MVNVQLKIVNFGPPISEEQRAQIASMENVMEKKVSVIDANFERETTVSREQMMDVIKPYVCTLDNEKFIVRFDSVGPKELNLLSIICKITGYYPRIITMSNDGNPRRWGITVLN
jgi:hypothetical protein